MADQIIPAKSCRLCGTPLSNDSVQMDPLCEACAQTAPPVSEVPPQQAPPDPDLPAWGPAAGLGVWFFSLSAILVLPMIAAIVCYIVQAKRKVPVPALTATQDLIEWFMSPSLLLVQMLSTVAAHIITIAICWAVVTKRGNRPFWASLGWHWAGRSVWYWVLFSGCVIVGLFVISAVLVRFIPQSEDNPFADLLKSSQSVRVTIAFAATFTAPMVEETVHRGVLFAALRRYLGETATVAVVTVLFVAPHVPQYRGAWVSIIGLTLLSLTITLVRAKTKSILPSVLIHTLNNAVTSVFILFNKVS